MLSFGQITYPKITKDSLIVITPTQLKLTNLIFLEHNHFRELNLNLNFQIKEYKELVSKYSLREDLLNKKVTILTDQTDVYKKNLVINEQLLTKKDKQLKRSKKWVLGGFGVSTVLLIFILAK